MDFGDAIVALKVGRKVARESWNGGGALRDGAAGTEGDAWLSLTPGSDAVPAANIWSPNNRAYAESQPGQVVKVLPAITMKTATGEILMGWLASQTDMLAEDWTVVI